jgi:hypothetical protein
MYICTTEVYIVRMRLQTTLSTAHYDKQNLKAVYIYLLIHVIGIGDYLSFVVISDSIGCILRRLTIIHDKQRLIRGKTPTLV